MPDSCSTGTVRRQSARLERHRQRRQASPMRASETTTRVSVRVSATQICARPLEGELASPDEARRLCASTMLGTMIVAMAYAHNDTRTAWSGLVVLGNSLNYWRSPRMGWRRSLDFLGASVFMVAMVVRSSHAAGPLRLAVQVSLAAGVACFAIACHEWRNRSPSWSWWHVAFHAICAVAVSVLIHGGA